MTVSLLMDQVGLQGVFLAFKSQNVNSPANLKQELIFFLSLPIATPSIYGVMTKVIYKLQKLWKPFFLKVILKGDENSSNSNIERDGRDKDVTSQTGHVAECTESSMIASNMELSTDEETLPWRQRSQQAAAQEPEIPKEIHKDIEPFKSTWLPKVT